MAEDQRTALAKASKPPSRELFSMLITANHILHYHNVVDAFGHISVRNPQDPSTFFISKSLAPALVASREDIEEAHMAFRETQSFKDNIHLLRSTSKKITMW